jgi:hypothetical protein
LSRTYRSLNIQIQCSLTFSFQFSPLDVNLKHCIHLSIIAEERKTLYSIINSHYYTPTQLSLLPSFSLLIWSFEKKTGTMYVVAYARLQRAGAISNHTTATKSGILPFYFSVNWRSVVSIDTFRRSAAPPSGVPANLNFY